MEKKGGKQARVQGPPRNCTKVGVRGLQHIGKVMSMLVLQLYQQEAEVQLGFQKRGTRAPQNEKRGTLAPVEGPLYHDSFNDERFAHFAD